jgi:hypothetical protein
MGDYLLVERLLQEDMKYRGFPLVQTAQTGQTSRRPKCRKKRPVAHI